MAACPLATGGLVPPEPCFTQPYVKRRTSGPIPLAAEMPPAAEIPAVPPNPSNQRLLASVFDRLIVMQRDEEATPQNPQSLSLSDLQANVFRDLALMLNSRQALTEPLPEDSELRQSVIAYGLPDICNVNPDNLANQASIRAAVEEAIRLFEPRLTNVSVISPSALDKDLSLRLTIKATLKAEPNPIPVEFDTVIESGTSEWVVNKPKPRK